MRRAGFVAVVLAIGVCGIGGAQVVEAPAAHTTYEVGFSPGGGAFAVVEKAIRMARESILVACYEFTNREIADALLEAAARGVTVRVVADERASEGRYSETRYLSRMGIEVRLDSHYAIMHDKFMVIDGASVETGSFNYTLAAVRENAENALLVIDAPDLARAYTAEWRRLWVESAGE